MLADAAVVGKVFWAGAIAQMGERDLTEVTDTLRELSRKELVRPARRSSIEGEAEYAFWHVLARDVAYASAAASLAGIAPRRRGGAGSSPRLPSESRTSLMSSPTTTRRRSSSREPPGRPIRRPSSRHRR